MFLRESLLTARNKRPPDHIGEASAKAETLSGGTHLLRLVFLLSSNLSLRPPLPPTFSPSPWNLGGSWWIFWGSWWIFWGSWRILVDLLGILMDLGGSFGDLRDAHLKSPSASPGADGDVRGPGRTVRGLRGPIS